MTWPTAPIAPPMTGATGGWITTVDGFPLLLAGLFVVGFVGPGAGA